MIAEILLILAGHSAESLFRGESVQPSFAPLLHPGEKQCLESLYALASRYNRIKSSCNTLTDSNSSRYIRTLCSTLTLILKAEYESLILSTESRILHRDASLVARGSFVPLSSIRAIFASWDAPFAALVALFDEIEATPNWPPGPLIDMLMVRSRTGVHRIADIISRLCVAVQRVWRAQLMAFIVHGTVSPSDPLASDSTSAILDGSMPACVSVQSGDAIAYVGRAIATVKKARWQKQPPRELAKEHTVLLESVLPEDQHRFELVIQKIRENISEWLWDNVLTYKMVEDAVDALTNYFLIRNGEFSLSLIREIERLKMTRLTTRSGTTSMIREQDLNIAVLRASLGTTAQHDPALSQLHFTLPSGPLRPLLPSLANTSKNHTLSNTAELTTFDDLLLGTRLHLSFTVTWPLDLFLHPSDLQIYSTLFSYLSSLRKTHTQIHTCWSSLSNSQRARRRWTGLSDGGTAEDLEARRNLLRCGWGIVRDMEWFLDTVLGYVMTDVVDVEYRRLKGILERRTSGGGAGATKDAPTLPSASRARANSNPASTGGGILDFATLRDLHATFLDRVYTGCLLSYPALTAILRAIFEVCERFVAQVERWGGDVLPALLFEGSLRGEDKVGSMVLERQEIVAEINETLHTLLETFYEQLSLSTSQQPFADSSKSVMMSASLAAGNTTRFQQTTAIVRRKGVEGVLGAEVRRHVERLLLRLDFNGGLSKSRIRKSARIDGDILKEGGLA